MEKHDHQGVLIFLLITIAFTTITIAIATSCEDSRLEGHIDAIETRIAGTPTPTPISQLDALSTQVAELKGGTK